MTEHDNGPEEQTEPKEVGNQLMRMVAWFAVAAVGALVVGLCLLVLSLTGVI